LRIAAKPFSQYPWYLRPFFWNQKRKYGQVLLPALIWGRVPLLFACIALLYGVFERRRARLDPALRSLVTVRVSQINWCRFCMDINAFLLATRTGSSEKVEALPRWRESGLFSAEEKAVLEYTEAVTFSDRRVSDKMIDDLRGFFDEDAVVELTGLISFQNLSSKFNSALDVPPQGFCSLPSANPEESNFKSG
jgi:AhpD family alkylhydroperoxidase